MKKILLTGLACLTFVAGFAMAATSHAGEKITVIGMSPSTSVATTFGRAYNGAAKGSFYQAANCEDAFKKFKNTPNSVAIYNSSVEFAARNKGLDCAVGEVKNLTKVTFVGKTHMSICRRPGTKFGFDKNETSLGMVSLYSTKAHEAKFRNGGANINIIAYPGAKAVARGLWAKEIDLGWIGNGYVFKNLDRLDCIANTDPSASNYIGKQIKLAVPDFRIQYMVYTNSTDTAVLAKLADIANDKKFSKFLDKSGTYGEFTIPSDIVASTIKYVDSLYINWADTKKTDK